MGLRGRSESLFVMPARDLEIIFKKDYQENCSCHGFCLAIPPDPQRDICYKTPELKKVCEDRGYSYMDFCKVCSEKMSNYEEICYCVAGSGYFDVRDCNEAPTFKKRDEESQLN